MSVFDTSLEEKELSDYMTEVDGQLESENSSFVNGDGIYVGSKMLRDFYKGRHWSFRKEGGGAMRTYNYCSTVVENFTAFLANETPESHSQPRDISDPIDRARSEGITEFINEIHRINKLSIQYQKGVRIGSLTGVSFVFGPVYDDATKVIRYWNIENVENIRPIWRDENFTEMLGFINDYRINLAAFKKQFKAQLAARGIDPATLKALDKGNSATTIAKGGVSEPMWERGNKNGMSDVPMVRVKEYYDDTYYMVKLVSGNSKEGIVVDFIKHDYGYVPGYWVPNIHLPGEAKGTSDIENLLDAQVAYNESKSNEEDIVRQVAFSALWGRNLDNYSVIDTGAGQIYNFNDEADLQAMPRSQNPVVLSNFEQAIQGDLINISGQNQALYPGGARQVLASTGRALSVLMQGINNKVSLRKTFWRDMIETLNRNILILTEQKIKNGKELIDGNYRTEVFISSVLLRDVTEEINKFNAKLQSMTTTQKNLGISSPSEEQKLMKEELKDPIFGVEIARQPGLLQSVIQQAVQMEMQGMGAGGGMPGEEGAVNPEAAILGAGEGEPAGSQPAATPQQRNARSTPEGEARAQGQRRTGAPAVRATR